MKKKIGILVEPRAKLDRDILRGIYRFANALTDWEIAQECWDRFPDVFDRRVRGAEPGERLTVSRWLDCAGLIVRDPAHPVLENRLITGGCVVITGQPLLYPRVWVDDTRLGETVGEYFAARGYRNCLLIGDQTIPAFANREKGFVQSLERAKRRPRILHPREVDKRAVFDVTVEGHVVLDALQKSKRPLAVAAVDAPVGRRVLQACRVAGISVPNEVSVVSCEYDDLIGMACRPQLSGVDVPGEAMGYEAAALLQNLLGGRQREPRSAPVYLSPGKVMTRGSSDAQSIDEPCLIRALDYMKSNLSRSISIDEVAAHSKTHRRTLEQKFRNELGRSPYQELRRLRLHKAHEMISNTDKTMTEIGALCGYCHLAHLDSHFQRVHGCSPTEYRRRVLLRGHMNMIHQGGKA